MTDARRQTTTVASRLLLATVLAGLGATSRAHAAPTVIRAEMLGNLEPTLGQGYSLATNSLLGTCLTQIEATPPSNDFTLDHADLTAADLARWVDKNEHPSLLAARELLDHHVQPDPAAGDPRRPLRYRHALAVALTVDAYYYSLDEKRAVLTGSAAARVSAKDMMGLFDACGMYYVRSVSRRARLVSVITYETASASYDPDLGAALSKQLLSAEPALRGDRDDVTVIAFDARRVAPAGLEVVAASDLAALRAVHQQVVSGSWPSFVEQSVVMSMEVVPWLEHPEVTDLYAPVAQTVPVRDARGQPVMDTTDPANPRPQTITVAPYAQKRTLLVNGEFLAELRRAEQAKRRSFEKAKQCRAQLEHDYMQQDERGAWQFVASGEVGPDGVPLTTGDRWIASHVPGDAGQAMRVRELSELLTDKRLHRIWMEYDSFANGGHDPVVANLDDASARTTLAEQILLGTKTDVGYPINVFPGAKACIAELTASGAGLRSYRTVPACLRLEEHLAVIAGRSIDEYCLPTAK